MAIEGTLLRAPAADNRRSAARRKLFLDLQAETAEGASSNVTALNLSATGILLRTSQRMELGERIRISLPEGEAATAKVVWSSGDLYGCKFERRISPARASAAQLQSRFDEPGEDRSTPAPSVAEETFGARLRRLSLQRGLGLSELASSVAVSKTTAWKWQRDQVLPRRAALDRLSKVLQVAPGELLFGADAEVEHTAFIHELKNLLQVVRGYLELTAGRTADPTSLNYLEQARYAAEQMDALTRPSD